MRQRSPGGHDGRPLRHNADLIDDGALDPQKPELLVYESKDGQLHLVAVEYLVFAEA